MDVTIIKERYINEYEKLVNSYKKLGIVELLNELNKAISKSELDKINYYFNKVSEWNDRVSNLQGARSAINEQYKYLNLPSVSEFLIVFDYINKEWRFNTDPD